MFGLAAVGIYHYQKIQMQQLVIDMTHKRVTALEGGLMMLQSQNRRNRTSIENLLIQQDQISQEQSQQHRIQNDYATVKEWSDVLLPAELTSLLKRSAQNGYNGNDAAVRTDHAVSAKRIPTTEKR